MSPVINPKQTAPLGKEERHSFMFYHHIKRASERKSQKVPLFLIAAGCKTLHAFNVFELTHAEEVNYGKCTAGMEGVLHSTSRRDM